MHGISAPRSRTFPQLHPTSNTLSLHSYLYPAAQLCAASTAINTSNALFIWIVHTRCWHFDCKTHKRELTKIPNSSCPGLYTKKQTFCIKTDNITSVVCWKYYSKVLFGNVWWHSYIICTYNAGGRQLYKICVFFNLFPLH